MSGVRRLVEHHRLDFEPLSAGIRAENARLSHKRAIDLSAPPEAKHIYSAGPAKHRATHCCAHVTGRSEPTGTFVEPMRPLRSRVPRQLVRRE